MKHLLNLLYNPSYLLFPKRICKFCESFYPQSLKHCILRTLVGNQLERTHQIRRNRCKINERSARYQHSLRTTIQTDLQRACKLVQLYHHTADTDSPQYDKNLVLSGKLWTYLADLNEQAQNRLDCIITQMKAVEGITEELKARDQMAWIRAMNSIRLRAEEIVRSEIVFR